MKKIAYFLSLISMVTLLSQCRKNSPEKLENPFGLLLLGSDTTLADGRYVIRTDNGCSGWANALRIVDNVDEVLDMNGVLHPVDHIILNDIDTLMVWHVKKVRYVSPDPTYALAFGYRIYQYRPDGSLRFLSLYATASTDQWTDDVIGDGGGKSVKANMYQLDAYPADPPVPTAFSTSSDTAIKPGNRYLFQFYESPDKAGFKQLRSGGRYQGLTGSSLVERWKFCTAYWDATACDGNAQSPHFRESNADCEQADDGRRCYIDDFMFQKVY